MREISRRGIGGMWKSRGKIRHMLNRRLKCSLRNYRMKIRISKVTQHD
jgi:hypothetical protein